LSGVASGSPTTATGAMRRCTERHSEDRTRVFPAPCGARRAKTARNSRSLRNLAARASIRDYALAPKADNGLDSHGGAGTGASHLI
jgi:predicted deacylase